MHFNREGNADSFKNVLDSKPYGKIAPKKLECKGNVKKRLGTTLRKLRSEMKSENLQTVKDQ